MALEQRRSRNACVLVREMSTSFPETGVMPHMEALRQNRLHGSWINVHTPSCSTLIMALLLNLVREKTLQLIFAFSRRIPWGKRSNQPPQALLTQRADRTATPETNASGMEGGPCRARTHRRAGITCVALFQVAQEREKEHRKAKNK
ncbi:hypothetical protein TraAM80_07208 [Trypanosoma rangeli]|uniref:Uncharacterized protein n=1 Tax=Trypanosoma rangeli TaxID=5698 RepID=A0A3S5IQM2_TRYRA|nr:uncharacterized protein TraAM80_07208 [Trypanosoma rangeli]RNF01108.1 hypothetical protein TraAM80_07208 [Trypanosoma rangeli]|eukprot:RNF01108.1 hypothetical protein TraAM80_07208 [Trypanosoma rangeli]